MQLALSLAVLAVLCGQALASLNCTVAARTLTKRLCESNSCPVFQTVARGEILHAACRADCSTDNEPWLKLYDGTYVLATKETISGCHNFCQPYSVLGLPRCKDAHPSCSPSSLKARATTPIPLGPEPAPLPAIAAKCGIALSPAIPNVGLARRSRLLSQTYANPNSTVSIRGVNGTIYTRGVNGTLYTRGVNSTDLPVPAGIFPPTIRGRAPFLNATDGIAARNWNLTAAASVGGWSSVAKRAPDGALNSTFVAGAPYVNSTETKEATIGVQGRVEAEKRSLSDPAFRNGSWSGDGAVGRRSPRVMRKLKFWA